MESLMSVCRADEEEEQRNHVLNKMSPHPPPSPHPRTSAAELSAVPPNETSSPNSESNENDDETNPPDELSTDAAPEGEAPTSGGGEETDAGANGEQQGVDDASGQSPQSHNGEGAAEIEDDEDAPPQKKQKSLSSLPDAAAAAFSTPSPATTSTPGTNGGTKKPKKKNNNVWTKPTSRKSKKKTKPVAAHVAAPEDTVLITPISRFPDKSDDSPDSTICLSRTYKAEKVELSDDRLTAGSTKGYRMVRATRGVLEGAWYFEIKVVRLGETGHTRLGWTTDKGDLQAPVGYDGNSFGYRDIDGSKVHKASREKYGEEGYCEGDVIGCYINLPDGKLYAPKPPNFVWYKGQRYLHAADGKDEPPKVVPGSEISFFKNGICQGVAFSELFGGRYYPAASMYTLPDQPNCEVRFNFGPDFDFFPEDFGGRPVPRPMIAVPYHGFDGKVEASTEKNVPEKKEQST